MSTDVILYVDRRSETSDTRARTGLNGHTQHTRGISPWACSDADGRAGALGANLALGETALKVLCSLSKSSALTQQPLPPHSINPVPDTQG